MEIKRKEGVKRIRIVEHNKTLLWVILVLFVILIGIVVYLALLNSSEKKIIGGDKDEHGCLIAAGYSWNETKEECVREWEEIKKTYCTEESRDAELCVDVYEPVCGNTFEITLKPKTYSNSCFACSEKDVQYYTKEECPKN